VKRLILVVLLFIIVLAIHIGAASPLEARPLDDTPTPAAPPLEPSSTSSSVITGQVINATAGQPAGSITVTLHVLQGDTEVNRLVSQADGQGRFRFAELDSRATMTYWTEAVYKGVSFSSGQPRPFLENQQTLSLPLDVFETTGSDAAISLERVHYIIGYDPRRIYLAELYIFSNGSQWVYVGRKGDGGQRETVRITLPPGAENVSSAKEGLDPRFKLTPHALIDTAPIHPGIASQAIFFVYELPYQGDAFTLEREVPYRVENVNILAEDVGPRLSGEQLIPLGTRQAQGQTYQSYTSATLEKGARLTIVITGLSSVRAATAPSVPVATISQEALRWLGVGLAVLALVAVGAYPWLRQTPARRGVKCEGGEAEARRLRLLQAIADLDDAYGVGTMNEDTYRRERVRHKAELIALMRGTPGGALDRGEQG
jgi:hypothetical protein